MHTAFRSHCRQPRSSSDARHRVVCPRSRRRASEPSPHLERDHEDVFFRFPPVSRRQMPRPIASRPSLNDMGQGFSLVDLLLPCVCCDFVPLTLPTSNSSHCDLASHSAALLRPPENLCRRPSLLDSWHLWPHQSPSKFSGQPLPRSSSRSRRRTSSVAASRYSFLLGQGLSRRRRCYRDKGLKL